jgi:RNA polymerase sigma-70 factor (ECF subfamily)
MARSKNATGSSVRINSESSPLRAHDEMEPERLSDEALAAQVARGNSAALEVLYEHYASTVLGLSLRVTGDRAVAEDVLQETFWRVWKNAGTYQPERGTFASWLFRIARNLAIDSYRRQSTRPRSLYNGETGGPILDNVPDPGTDVAKNVQSAIQNREIRRALASLPGSQRQVIEMAYFYGMTRQEIAEVTGEALGTIHTRARLGLQKLREELDKEEFEG